MCACVNATAHIFTVQILEYVDIVNWYYKMRVMKLSYFPQRIMNHEMVLLLCFIFAVCSLAIFFLITVKLLKTDLHESYCVYLFCIVLWKML